MRQTYSEAINQVFKDEGGYSNVPGDHGGPTNFGITISDARRYWKPSATAEDVRTMPKSVASNIYQEHYANPIGYDNLPPGNDYATLDYVVNSGVGKASLCKGKTIDQIYDQRELFLRAIAKHPGQGKFLPGWMNRTRKGRIFAHQLAEKYKQPIIPPAHGGAAGTVIAGGSLAAIFPHAALYIIPIALVAAVGIYFLIKRKTK